MRTIQAYVVRKALNERGIQVSDALGALVVDGYKAKNGAIAADLLEEHSVLEDLALVETVKLERLQEAAEAKREAMGFAWADTLARTDHNALAEYDTVYPEPIEPDEAATAQLEEIEKEMDALYVKMDDEDISYEDHDVLSTQERTLELEARGLQEAFTEDDLARAGVVASWNGQCIQFHVGLVKPEGQGADASDPGAQAGATSTGADKVDDKISYSGALESDLKIERATALGAAIAQNAEATVDLVHFKLITDVLGMRVTFGFDVSASRNYEKHTKEDDIDQTPVDQLAQAQSDLDLSWDEDGRSPAEQFARFRALPTVEKHKLVAFATALTTQGCFARNRNRDSLMHDFEIEIMPNIRDHWTPNGAFFGRLKKAWLLNVLNHDLGLTQEALNLSSSSKKEIVAFMDKLFTEPFATPTEAQRSAVECWCPPSMQTSGGYAPEALTGPQEGAEGPEGAADVAQDMAA